MWCHKITSQILMKWGNTSDFISQTCLNIFNPAQTTFTKTTCDRCSSLQKEGDIIATFQLALRLKCDSPRTGCARWATYRYMWHEQAITEWSRWVIYIVACCNSVKLCRLAARALIAIQEIYFLISIRLSR